MSTSIVGAVMATIFVFGPAVGWTGGVPEAAIENRHPAPAPKPADGWGALDKIGPWAADHLPGRSRAVRTKSWLDYHVLREVPVRRPAPGPTTTAPTGNDVPVLRGGDGYLFLGQEFTHACVRRNEFDRALASYQRLAEIIGASGRRVVFTIAPNKSAVVGEHLPRSLPDGDCARQGVQEQNAKLDRFRHPLWLSLRERLVAAQAAGQQPYWRTDTHWSPTGAAIFAQVLAEHLQPGLAGRIQLKPERMTWIGDLTKLLGLSTKETAQPATLSTGATVTQDPGHVQYDPLQHRYGLQRWTTAPASGLVPDRTLILGDSFSYFGLGNLRPLFANGAFLWTDTFRRSVPAAEDEVIGAVKAADTVVLQIVQRNLGLGHPYLRPAFQAKLAAALR